MQGLLDQMLGAKKAFLCGLLLCCLMVPMGVGQAMAQEEAPAHDITGLQAESAYYWNHALYRMLHELNRFDRRHRPMTSGDNPPRTTRAMAMVHGAMFDAVNGISGQYQPFLVKGKPKTPASREAAVMEASYLVMNALFGENGTELTQRGNPQHMQAELNSYRQTDLVRLYDRVDNGELSREALENGRSWGREVAEAMLAWRANDGATMQKEYDDRKPAYGKYSVDMWTPDALSRPAEPAWGGVKPFIIAAEDEQFMLAGPPAVGSEEWNKNLEEVRGLGRRSRYDPEQYPDKALPEEVQEHYRIAYFWAAKGLNPDGRKNSRGTLTPAGQWTHVADYIAQERDITLEDATRLYALMSISMADATITGWKAKYHFDLWRPVHAIRWQKGADHADANWLPLIPTSMHPEYVSGHAVMSGAASRVLARFFGDDKIEFVISGTDALDGEYRRFGSFRAAAEEAIRSRIYGGIHYTFSGEDGLKLGTDIGQYTYEHAFLPRETNMSMRHSAK